MRMVDGEAAEVFATSTATYSGGRAWLYLPKDITVVHGSYL